MGLIKAGEIVEMADMDLPDSLALRAWHDIEGRIRAAAHLSVRAQSTIAR
jgi:hypothetical protein